MDSSEKPVFIQLKSTITKIRMDNFYYNSCPSVVDWKKCMKKLIPQNTCMWFFQKCNTKVTEHFLKIGIPYRTHELAWTAGSKILGNNAKDFYLSWVPDLMKEIVSKPLWRDHTFTLLVKTETFKGISWFKCIIMKYERLHFTT